MTLFIQVQSQSNVGSRKQVQIAIFAFIACTTRDWKACDAVSGRATFQATRGHDSLCRMNLTIPKCLPARR